MDTINFTQNFNNKLMLNSYFTTIRPFSPTKHIVGVLKKCQYPRKGEMVEFITEIIDVTQVMLDKIPNFVFCIDTGYPKDESIRMFENMYKNKGMDVHTHRFAIITLKHRPDLEVRANQAKAQRNIQQTQSAPALT